MIQGQNLGLDRELRSFLHGARASSVEVAPLLLLLATGGRHNQPAFHAEAHSIPRILGGFCLKKRPIAAQPAAVLA
jgi:hypothetical protein